MIILVIADDTPGWRETFYKGPFSTMQEALEKRDKFNDQARGNWVAYIVERESMPDQEQWEREVYASYGPT